MSLGFASGPLPLVKLLYEVPGRDFNRGARRDRAFRRRGTTGDGGEGPGSIPGTAPTHGAARLSRGWSQVVRPRQPAACWSALRRRSTARGENGEVRSSGGAAWYGGRNGVVGSGGGRPEVGERRCGRELRSLAMADVLCATGKRPGGNGKLQGERGHGVELGRASWCSSTSTTRRKTRGEAKGRVSSHGGVSSAACLPRSHFIEHVARNNVAGVGADFGPLPG
jgi:hypothetical protein